MLERITVIKIVRISKFTDTMLSLPTPMKSCLDEIDGLLHTFLWGNIPPKYRTDILESKQTGLSYTKLYTCNNALKYLGVRKYTQLKKSGEYFI